MVLSIISNRWLDGRGTPKTTLPKLVFVNLRN